MAILDHNVQDLEDIKQLKHGQSPLSKVGPVNEDDDNIDERKRRVNREEEYLRRI